MNEKLGIIKENSILTLSNWWGLSSPRKSEIMITKDKKIYNYTEYY